jgi:glycosyltransferase involved in cell wall biosynthesis
LPQLQKLKNIDFILSNSSEPIAALETDIPMAYWADACFAGMLGYYPEFDRVHPDSIKEANLLEQKALEKAKYVFFSSEWAARTALENYKVDSQKIKVVPFGANVSHANTLSDIQAFADQKSIEVCKLLFIGVYWERKGGDIALKITESLNKSGIKTELIIVGSKPFDESNKLEYVRQEGFLSKKDPGQQQRLDQLFKESHFLVVPSRAECYGLVYCEANSYGLPAIGTKTGGIPTIIKDGINGFTFDLNSTEDEYVKFISRYFTDKKLYNELSVSSFREYESRLNWKVTGTTVSGFLKEYNAS